MEKSRLAEIEAIVERGTFAIEGSVHEDSMDKIFLRSHFYSNKPPMLSVLASAVYAAEHRLLGWSFRSQGGRVIYSLTYLVVGGAVGILLAIFYASLGLWPIDEWQRLTLTASLGLATLLLPYSTGFNNHVVAATLSFGAFWLLLRARVLKTWVQPSVIVGGFLAALAASIDVVPGTGLLAAFAAYTAASLPLRRFWLGFAAAAMVPIAGFFALNFAITGGFAPPYNNFAFYQYKGSQWVSPTEVAGAVLILQPKLLWNQLGLMLFSADGFFSLMPILYVPLVAMVRTVLRRDEFWPEALTVLAGSVAIIGGFTILKQGLSGLIFGFRYLIPLIPFLLFFAPAVFEANPTPFWQFLAISAIYSTGFAVLGLARGTLVGRPLLDLTDVRVVAFFRLNYVLLAAFLGLCGLAAVRALLDGFRRGTRTSPEL